MFNERVFFSSLWLATEARLQYELRRFGRDNSGTSKRLADVFKG